MKKLLLLIFSLVTLAGYSQTTLSANPDTFTVIQARIDTFAVTSNDSIPLGDSVCITLLDTVRFTVLGCTSIVYHPDTTFTGRDTCRYVLCDTALVCDTSMIIVFVDSDGALLPVASFAEDSSYNGNWEHQKLFGCQSGVFAPILGWETHKLFSTSSNADSLTWELKPVLYGCPDSTRIFHSDTIAFALGYTPSLCYPDIVCLCLTAYNKYGRNTFCDTSCYNYYEGISEVPLAHINLYPTPASQTLIIDMSQNTDDISTHYTAIDLYNALGQKVRTISKQNNNKIINVPVATLPDGIYLATISDAAHAERMLGKFTIAR